MAAIGVENLKVIDFQEATKPSALEQEYIRLYGRDFVDDLRQAYLWMKKDMKRQPPAEEIKRRRMHTAHKTGDWITVFFVDLRKENFYSQTIDERGGKTLHNYNQSPCLATDSDHNVRYLLSGLYFYDPDKAKKWLVRLLGEGEKFWYEKA